MKYISVPYNAFKQSIAKTDRFWFLMCSLNLSDSLGLYVFTFY